MRPTAIDQSATRTNHRMSNQPNIQKMKHMHMHTKIARPWAAILSKTRRLSGHRLATFSSPWDTDQQPSRLSSASKEERAETCASPSAMGRSRCLKNYSSPANALLLIPRPASSACILLLDLKPLAQLQASILEPLAASTAPPKGALRENSPHFSPETTVSLARPITCHVRPFSQAYLHPKLVNLKGLPDGDYEIEAAWCSRSHDQHSHRFCGPFPALGRGVPFTAWQDAARFARRCTRKFKNSETGARPPFVPNGRL